MSASDKDPPSRRTLLIGSEALLGAWSGHASEASQVTAVAHTDLAQTLHVIDQTQPDVVVVEQALASTESGQVLMARLHSERASRDLEISLLTPEGVNRILSTGPGDVHPQHWLIGLARSLPSRPTRGAARVRVATGEELLIDGRPATLLDLSSAGVQVRSSSPLRPNQHVRVVLAQREALRTAGIVAWSTLEVGAPPTYRAGIAFTSPVPALAEEVEQTSSKKSKKPRTPRAPRKSR